MIDENEKHHTRTIYSLLDFLGDIGGLSDALSKIGSIVFAIAQLFTGSGLRQYLLKNIFTLIDRHYFGVYNINFG